jgi:hypothetical protein
MDVNKHFKICNNCKEKIIYKTIESYWANKNKSSPCKKCTERNHSLKLKGKKRMPFSDTWKKNISNGHKKSDVWIKSMNTSEYKQKHREKMLRLIKEQKTKVCINKTACNFFNLLNVTMNWNGYHGFNEKEYQLNYYFLDYYDINNNIVIEWDEKYHNKKKQKEKDIIRQKYIIETLNCNFYRIDEITKKVYKVDNCSIDYSKKIQEVLNEFENGKKSY